jgi:hypothetical protein
MPAIYLKDPGIKVMIVGAFSAKTINFTDFREINLLTNRRSKIVFD